MQGTESHLPGAMARFFTDPKGSVPNGIKLGRSCYLPMSYEVLASALSSVDTALDVVSAHAVRTDRDGED